MPIIEYFCRKCRHKFEELILKRDKVNGVKCPKCGSKNLQRLISAFCFNSKGSSKRNSVGSSCTSCAQTSCAGCSK